MPKKAGPSLLCEWMVGTTIRSALGPPPKPPKPKPKKRDVIKLHVTTDDESGEDTLTITYPRSEKLSPKKETQAAVSESEPESEPEPEVVEVLKKVRFEKEAVPRKSAMKKKTSVTFCEEEETKPDSGTDATSTSASSGEATPEASSSNASSGAETSSAGETSSDESSKAAKVKPAKSPRKKKAEKPVQSSESEADSDPHPTCECKECMSGRKKQKQETICEKKKCKKNDKKAVTKKKNDPETESEPETSASEAESSAEEKPTPSKKSKERKKGKKKAEISETEGETSESAKETEAESEEQQKKSPEKKKVEKKADTPKAEDAKKDADKKEEEAEKGNNTEEAKKAEESKPEKSPTGKGKEKEADEANKPTTTAEAATSPTPQAKDSGQNVHYPQGYYSHSRPPNLIAPIRTEVMQTERVVETKDDPLPNAYYDALHNVVRVYHGSVYGQNGHQNFAPRENTTGYSHPPGMSHPMQNPYYPYYNNVMPIPPPLPLMPPHGYEHGPITPGMPVPGWNGMVPPPPGFPGYNYQGGPLPMPAGWYEQQQNKQGTKGAYSMFNGMGNTPDSKGSKDKSREPDNNVMPEVMKPNPYYTKRQSPFSNMGSNRSVSNGKAPSHAGNSNCSRNGGGSQRGSKDAAPNWDTTSRRSVGAWANSSNHGATWGDAPAGDTYNNQSGGDQWGTGGDTWHTTNNNDRWNNTGGDQWGAGSNNGGWNGSGNDQNTQGGWDASDNANNSGGATWGDGTTNDQQQTNDNTGNDGNGQGQDPGQSQSNSPAKSHHEPTPDMMDNNVMPAAAAVTGPPEEPSKMPGSWYSENDGQAAFVDPPWSAYQPPSGVPDWADPTLAASTRGKIDLW